MKTEAINIQIEKALHSYKLDKSSVKPLLTSMKEISEWLKSIGN